MRHSHDTVGLHSGGHEHWADGSRVQLGQKHGTSIDISTRHILLTNALQSFASICTLTDAPEGTIVRTIVRLDETCRDFRNAARIVGDTALASKMEAASQLIKRDIVFASSLYY
jgi:hypothetical protein